MLVACGAVLRAVVWREAVCVRGRCARKNLTQKVCKNGTEKKNPLGRNGMIRRRIVWKVFGIPGVRREDWVHVQQENVDEFVGQHESGNAARYRTRE